jgi:hypothetical protein
MFVNEFNYLFQPLGKQVPIFLRESKTTVLTNNKDNIDAVNLAKWTHQWFI